MEERLKRESQTECAEEKRKKGRSKYRKLKKERKLREIRKKEQY